MIYGCKKNIEPTLKNMIQIDSIRKEYTMSGLRRSRMEENPFRQFSVWLDEAIQSAHPEPTAMSVITAGPDGYPESRIVLLKYFTDEGFVFFTNYLSNKGKSLSADNRAGLHFFWPGLERQVRIAGTAEKTNAAISDEYFYSRPEQSQIGAIISAQSQEIPSREYLDAQFKIYAAKYASQKPERPDQWGGYCVKPVRFEFWQGRENRLHDRIIYVTEEDRWVKKRLAP
jgi:pyridoxamine 5'-phosphate oxidase